MTVEKKRSLVTLGTPLDHIPREWLQHIEPKLIRPPGTTCWLWTGACDKDGIPVMSYINMETGKRNTRRLNRFVAGLFWALEKWHQVLPSCRVLNCLNPAHFYISECHYTQENRPSIIRTKKRKRDRYQEIKLDNESGSA